ncbi:MAG: hypothetical protein Q4P24_07350 [Rhodobacterales bacterium]|nr:hypothetical protein [Rhodobacterales bacterium]
MSAPVSLLGHWYALGPEGVTFYPGHPDFGVFRVVEDNPALPDVLIENDAGQRFILARDLACEIAIPPIQF